MKFQVAVATLSTTVGLSAFAIDAKEEKVVSTTTGLPAFVIDVVDAKKKLVPSDLGGQRKMKEAGGILNNFAPVDGKAESPPEIFSPSYSEDSWSFSKDETSTFDIGILGSNAKDSERDHRQLQLFETMMDTYGSKEMYDEPLKTSIDFSCYVFDYFDDIGEAYGIGPFCTSCGAYPVIDPISGNDTGAYSVGLNCPYLGETASDLGIEPPIDLNEAFQAYCEDGAFCPNCPAVCQSCSFDFDKFALSLENCMVTTDEQRAGIEKYRLEGLPLASSASMSSASMLTFALAGASILSMMVM